MEISPEQIEQAVKVFFPHYHRTRQGLVESKSRLAYYTTADTAIKVISNGQIWMRNTAVMNDFMEVKHGLECLNNALGSEAGKRLNEALDECMPGLTFYVMNRFNNMVPHLLNDSYVTSFSEHSDDEDQFGRLSMWRAYGASTGIALVFNSGPFVRPSRALRVTASPVAYIGPEGVAKEIVAVAESILKNRKFIQELGLPNTAEFMLAVLRHAALCTKHPAFREEKEWRVIASPQLYPDASLPLSFETIGSVPQPVVKLPLQDRPENNLVGLNIPDFLDRVLIGPCEHAETIRFAVLNAMEKAGVQNPASKIFNTQIPLRANQR